MSKRVPASMRTRQSLSDLIAGRLASPDGRAELVKLATRLIVRRPSKARLAMRSGGSTTHTALSPAAATGTGSGRAG